MRSFIDSAHGYAPPALSANSVWVYLYVIRTEEYERKLARCRKDNIGRNVVSENHATWKGVEQRAAQTTCAVDGRVRTSVADLTTRLRRRPLP